MADAEPQEKKLKDTIDDIMDRVIKATGELKGELKPLGENLRREVRAAGRDLKRLFDQGWGGIEALTRDWGSRPFPAMTRLTHEDVQAIDALVSAGLFESRSECIAYLTHVGIESRSSLLDRIKETAGKIQELKEELRREVS